MRDACILLSTYNGEKYLVETLKSIENQQNISVHVFCRDDGSTDGTLAVLESFKNRISMDVIKGDNIGSNASFDWLLRNCSDDFLIYAFCDQDDVWASKKLSRAMTSLRDTPNPELLVTCYSYFKEKNNLTMQRVPNPSLRNALIENNYLGATMVLSRSLLLCYRKIEFDFYGFIDSYVNLFSSLFHSVSLLNEPLVAYRLHDLQQVGLGQSKKIIKRLQDSNKMMLFQIFNTRELSVYIVSPELKKEIERHMRGVLGIFFQRLLYSSHPLARRTNFITNYYFKFLIITGFFRRKIVKM